MQSAERVSSHDISDNYVYQRSLLAYRMAAEIVSGDVLEIGTGSGYGAKIISPVSDSFLTVDKSGPPEGFEAYGNAQFLKMKVPPLRGIRDGSFDFVIMFQVIEHVRADRRMIGEIHRVLRPGGRLIISTPNREMSLTRNPWHVREYSVGEFTRMLEGCFAEVETLGVYGSENVMEYYAGNKQSVRKIARLDVFRFQKWLPSPLLRIPYDVLNRMNRRKLLKTNEELTTGITMKDYFTRPADDACFDIISIARK